MRRVSRNKRVTSSRGGNEKSTFTLMVHGTEYGTGEELVINPECFPDAKIGDLLEISQPDREHERLILQVASLAPVRGKLQISILKDLAAQFRLEAFHVVVVQKIEPRDVTVDFIELTFKDQFLSRADIWRYKVAMYGKCVYIGKNMELLGIRAQVEALFANHQTLLCGVIGADTKMIVRSRSSRLFWLIQMSTEMWEFAEDGELYYEKLINRLIKILIRKWNASSVSHSLTIIAFSRSYYDKNQFPNDYDPSSPIFKEPNRQGFGPGCQASKMAEGYGPNIHIDAEGRYYEDFYKILVMNYCGPDWNHLLQVLKNEFAQYHRSHRWRLPDEFIPVDYEICQVKNNTNVSSNDQSPPFASLNGTTGQLDAIKYTTDRTATTTTTTATATTNPISSAIDTYVQWKSLPYGVPARAVEGNILEAINVTLNILDKHYMDRDLSRTGQGILMITAGSSVFKVEQRLAQITKQRMMDNGVGMDMISLTTPPLHVVPLFIWKKQKQKEDLNDSSSAINVTTTHSHSRGSSPSAPLNLSTLVPTSGSGPNTCDIGARNRTENGANGSLESTTGTIKGKTSEEILSSSMPMDKTRGLHSFMDLSTAIGSASPGTSLQDDHNTKKKKNLLDDGDHIYNIPHWVNITFLDFDCKCQDSQQKEQVLLLPLSPQNHSNTSQQQQQQQQQQLPKPSANNRLTQRMCECQWSMNNRFQPLPSFRMFDLTAPMEKLVLPMSLRNIMAFDRRRRDEERLQAQEQQEELNFKSSVDSNWNLSSPFSRVNRLPSSGSFSWLHTGDDTEAGKEYKKKENQQEQEGQPLSQSLTRAGGRKLSDLSDTLSSSLVPPDQWQLSRSPEYDFSLISALNNSVFGSGMGSFGFQGGNGPNSGPILETGILPHQENALHDRFSALSMTREALNEYDAAVFSPIISNYQTNQAASSTMGLVSSSSCYGGSISAVAAERSLRGGKSLGLTMAAASLLSPRNEAMIKGRRNQSQQSLRILPSSATVGSSGSNQQKLTSTLEGGPQRFLSSPMTEMMTGVGHPLQKAHTMSLFSKENLFSPPSKNKAIPTTVVEEIHSPARKMLSTSVGNHKDTTAVPSPQLGTVKNAVPSERILGKSLESSSALERIQQRQAMTGSNNMEKETKIKPSGEKAFSAQEATIHVSPKLSTATGYVMRTPPAQLSLLDRSPRYPSPLSPTFHDNIHNFGSGKGGALNTLVSAPSLRRGASDNASNPGNVLPSSLGAAGGYVGPSGASSAPYYLSYTINPFKFSSDLDGTSQRLTSNRRRWSHLFPAQQAEFQTKIHLGPNWKSLSSPAILPLTTDYYPSPKDLHIMYTESFYTLTLPSTSDDDRSSSTVPKYHNHHELLVEMVCQRLASDFQLVATEAGTDVDVSRHRVPAGSTKRGPSGESRDSESSIVYHLSMGHRIHQMIYDEELQTIEVKRYFKRASQSQNNEPHIYTYSLWVDATQSFHPFQQRFYEYPQPEDNWNTLDHLLCGYLEDMPDSTKCRRIRFALMPPPLSVFFQEAASKEKENYVSKFQKFLDYIQSRVTSERKINVKIVLSAPLRPAKSGGDENSSGSGSSNHHYHFSRRHTYLNYKITCDSSTRIKTDTRNEWVVIMLEDTMDISRNYHFDIRWLACSGIMAEEFVSTIKRKAKQAGLELRRIPEYSCVSFLQIHPLIAPIFLPMPHIGGESSNEHDSILESLLVERLGFVLDDERVADSNGIGYGLGIPREQKSWTKNLSRFQPRSSVANEKRFAELWKKRGYRQYMHRHTPFFLRLIHDGIIWIPGYQYDMETDTKKVEELFIEITNLIQTITTLHDLTQQVVQQANVLDI